MIEQLELNFDKLTNKQMIVVEHKAFKGGGKVAKVYVDKDLSIKEQLEKAYMLTQNIDDGWWNSKDVEKTVNVDAVRSTSVGDRMHINGELYLVDNVGFRKINNN
mgnify:FL=1